VEEWFEMFRITLSGALKAIGMTMSSEFLIWIFDVALAERDFNIVR
jgi:hypothetical protein